MFLFDIMLANSESCATQLSKKAVFRNCDLGLCLRFVAMLVSLAL